MKRGIPKMQTKKIYLAYGSNLNLAQMRHRCPDARLLGYTYLPNTRLVFRGSKTGSYLSIEPALEGEPRRVPCGVFAISKHDEQALDLYEGYPSFYYKQEYTDLPLYLLGHGTAQPHHFSGFAYQLPVDHPLGKPARWYMATCREGYRNFGFDTAVLDQALQDSDK